MWKNAFKFMDYTERNEFWPAVGIHILVYIIQFILLFNADDAGLILFSAYAILSFIPFLSLITRRLTDAGLSAGNLAYILIPGGIIVVLILCTKASERVHMESFLLDDDEDEEVDLSILGYGKK